MSGVSNKVIRSLTFLIGVIILSGCGQFKSLPDEERYQYINEVKNTLDYGSAGSVYYEEYDQGDGIFSPSTITNRIEGGRAYETLKDRIESLPNVKCHPSKTQISCNQGQVGIFLSQQNNEVGKISIILTDSYSGRNQSEK